MTVQLAIAQLHLSHGVVYKACDALKGLGDLQYKPGVVSGMFTFLCVCAYMAYMLFLQHGVLKLTKQDSFYRSASH